MSKKIHQVGPYILIMAETYRLCCLRLSVTVPRGLVEEILAGKGANFLLATSYHTQRDELMERPQ
jgi:hypothetical protein